MFDGVYFIPSKNNMTGFIANDGLVDSIKFLMSDFTYKNRFTVQSLLLPSMNVVLCYIIFFMYHVYLYFIISSNYRAKQ